MSTSAKRKQQEVKFELLPHQAEFVHSKAPYCALTAGLGTGKTHAACVFVILMIHTQPKGVRGFIGANSEKQLQRTVLPPVFSALNKANIRYEWKEQKKQIEIYRKGAVKVLEHTIYCGTTDRVGVESMLGTEIAWFWIDEVNSAPQESVELIEGRLRCPIAAAKNMLYGRFTGTPRGFNWYWERFVGPKKTDECHHIKATSYDNPYLPPEYIPRLKQRLSPIQFEQEVLAKFVNLKGNQVYCDFKEEKHVHEFDHRDILSPTYLGQDFNVAQMCGVLCKYENGVFWVYDEIYLQNSNTTALSKYIKENVPGWERLLLIPDSTFSHRNAVTQETSKQILEREGFKIMPGIRNPHITARQELMNAYFYNGGGDLKIVIHPRCKHLIAELNTLTHEDHEGSVSHLGPALGYVVWHLEPLKKPRHKPKMRYL